MNNKGRPPLKRWKYKIEYWNDRKPVLGSIDEIEELHQIVESGPNFYQIDTITIKHTCSPKLRKELADLEEAERIMTKEEFLKRIHGIVDLIFEELEKNGYAIVPVEPTEEMYSRGKDCDGNSEFNGSYEYDAYKSENVGLIYKAMIEAGRVK